MGLPKGKKKNGRAASDEPRINNEIYGYGEVRVVYKGRLGDESFSKVVRLKDAFDIADGLGLDLIEMNPKSVPPILLIDNYSKWRFEQKKNKVKQKTSQLKEIQLSTNISEHDMVTKLKAAEKFISEGDKVKVVQKMRGRELGRRELSKKAIYQFVSMMEGIAVPESMPKDEGNKCIVVLKKKVKH